MANGNKMLHSKFLQNILSALDDKGRFSNNLRIKITRFHTGNLRVCYLRIARRLKSKLCHQSGRFGPKNKQFFQSNEKHVNLHIYNVARNHRNHYWSYIVSSRYNLPVTLPQSQRVPVIPAQQCCVRFLSCLAVFLDVFYSTQDIPINIFFAGRILKTQI